MTPQYTRDSGYGLGAGKKTGAGPGSTIMGGGYGRGPRTKHGVGKYPGYNTAPPRHFTNVKNN